MNNPKIVAPLSALVALYLAYTIFGAAEAPSSTLNIMQWVFLLLAVAAFVGSIVQLTKSKE